MRRIWKEEWKTYGNVFSEFTNRNLFKLQSQGHFEILKSPVAIGKEANVFTAETLKGDDVIVKIYRLESVDFKRMYEYIKFDERYINMRRARRQIVFAWTQREFRNLMIAREAGLRVPLPIVFKDSIIVMEQIGNPEPAPKLKDYRIEEPERFLDQIITDVSKLWKNGLVHGDLSQFNILVEHDKPVIIDFSQSTMTNSTNAKELMIRDMRNVCNYFRKLGVDRDEEEITETILAKHRKDKSFLKDDS
jgi:RIO kinase 1